MSENSSHKSLSPENRVHIWSRRVAIWIEQEHVRQLVKFALKLIVIAFLYALILLFLNWVYSDESASIELKHQSVLVVCGIVAAIWATIRIRIVTDRLLKKLRAAKREKVDIPLHLWAQRTPLPRLAERTATYLSSVAVAGAKLTAKYAIWPFLPLLEPRREIQGQDEFLFAAWNTVSDFPNIGSAISDALKNRYGKSVEIRYTVFGYVQLGLIMLSLILLTKVMGVVFDGLPKPVVNVVLLLSLIGALHLPLFFLGALAMIQSRINVWRPVPLSAIYAQPEYMEIKEHLAQMTEKLTDTAAKVIETEKVLEERHKALTRIRSLDPEVSGSVAILLDVVMEEERAKEEQAEKRKAKIELLRDIAVNIVFFILGIVATITLRLFGF